MKKTFLALCLSLLLSISALPAYADGTIQDAIKANPELSEFYATLEQTGVLAEIPATGDYMVFAPVNSQFNAMLKNRAQCLAMEECKKSLASILRNHIVARTVSLKDAMQYKAGIFAVNNHFIPLTYIGAGRYSVEGQHILERHDLDNGILYVTDGVLANSHERSYIVAYQELPPATESKETNTVNKTTIPDPACGPEGCPNTKTTITTIKKTITEVSP